MNIDRTAVSSPQLPAPAGAGRLRAGIVNLAGLIGAGGVAAWLGNAMAAGRSATAVTWVGLASVFTAIAAEPGFGLLLWLLLAPFGQLFRLSLGRGIPDLGLNRLAAAFVLFLLVIQVATGRRRLLRLTAVEGAAVLFVLAMLLAVHNSHLGWAGGLQNVFDFAVLPLLMYYFARNLLGKPHRLQWVPVAVAVIGLALGFIAVREQLTHQPILSPTIYQWSYGRYSIRITSLFGAPAIMSLSLALTLPAIWVGAARSRTAAARVMWSVALAVAAAGVLLTYVRAGWLAAVIGLAVVIAFSRPARRFALLILPVVLVVALLLGGGLIDSRAIQERLESEGPITYRLEALQVGLQIARSEPIFGVGLDNYAAAAVAAGWAPRGSSGQLAVAPHNLFIYVLTSAGLLGLLPLLAILGLAAWRAFTLWRLGSRRPDIDRDLLAVVLAMLASYAAFAFTFDSLGAQFANLLLFAVVGAVFGEHDHVTGRRIR